MKAANRSTCGFSRAVITGRTGLLVSGYCSFSEPDYHSISKEVN